MHETEINNYLAVIKVVGVGGGIPTRPISLRRVRAVRLRLQK